MYVIIAHLPPPDSLAQAPTSAEVLDDLLASYAASAGVRLEHFRVYANGSSFSVVLFLMAENLELAELDAISLIRLVLGDSRRSAD
ncbi:hypothetical protein GCM10029978_064730 [Actinoallomurus acanthiterrae]